MRESSEARLAWLLAAVLRAGFVSSTVLLAAGVALHLVRLNPGLADWLTNAGLVVLMATPVARVLVSVADYAKQRDWLFVAMTGSVLLVLLASLLVATR
jgi:uncharacterized membrane protein